MMKYLINECYGGFSLSQEAYQWLIDNKGWKVAEADSKELYNSNCLKLIDEGFHLYKNCETNKKFLGEYSTLFCKSDLGFRSRSDLISCIETIGNRANGSHAMIAIIECSFPPDGLEIHDYDGMETLQTIPLRFN